MELRGGDAKSCDIRAYASLTAHSSRVRLRQRLRLALPGRANLTLDRVVLAETLRTTMRIGDARFKFTSLPHKLSR